MKPVSPVVPDAPNLKEIIVAETQDEYEDLPAVDAGNGAILTRWELDPQERHFVQENGYIYLWIYNHGRPVQPVLMEAGEPFNFRSREDE
jgi:hypothetical protein